MNLKFLTLCSKSIELIIYFLVDLGRRKSIYYLDLYKYPDSEIKIKYWIEKN